MEKKLIKIVIAATKRFTLNSFLPSEKSKVALFLKESHALQGRLEVCF